MIFNRAKIVGIAGFILCIFSIIYHKVIVSRVRDTQINKVN